LSGIEGHDAGNQGLNLAFCRGIKSPDIFYRFERIAIPIASVCCGGGIGIMSANESKNQRGESRPPIGKPSRIRHSDDHQDSIERNPIDDDRSISNDNNKTWPLLPFPDDWSS